MMDFSNVPIEDVFNESEKYSSVIERYYTPRYCMSVAGPGDDYCILIHSNRVCVVTLAPSHRLFGHSAVIKVDFQVSGGLNRLKNKVSGKWKHGAQKLTPDSTLMQVTCIDGASYHLRSAISGKLLEVNQQLLENPGLLLSEPQGRGHLAIVYSEIPLVDKYRDILLTEEQYKAKCEEINKEKASATSE